MRSQSRFVDNSVMKIVVKTPAADSAIAGKSGITIIDDYRGISVLSSYSPLNIPGLDWAILSEIDYSEAMKPIRSIETRILLITSIISILTFIITYLISKKITKPINRITSVINAIGSGKLSERNRIGANDEIGELADSINVMASKLQDQEIELEKEKKKGFPLLQTLRTSKGSASQKIYMMAWDNRYSR
jgi:methyl-accepting chemotaxis protein